MSLFRTETESVTVYFEAEIEHTREERATATCPGHGEYWELIGVRVTRVIGEFYDLRREDRPDWFKFADEAIVNAAEAGSTPGYLEWLDDYAVEIRG